MKKNGKDIKLVKLKRFILLVKCIIYLFLYIYYVFLNN